MHAISTEGGAFAAAVAETPVFRLCSYLPALTGTKRYQDFNC